jgi:hypothetical protein
MIKRSRAGRLALRHHAAVGGQPGGFFYLRKRQAPQILARFIYRRGGDVATVL